MCITRCPSLAAASDLLPATACGRERSIVSLPHASPREKRTSPHHSLTRDVMSLVSGSPFTTTTNPPVLATEFHAAPNPVLLGVKGMSAAVLARLSMSALVKDLSYNSWKLPEGLSELPRPVRTSTTKVSAASA